MFFVTPFSVGELSRGGGEGATLHMTVDRYVWKGVQDKTITSKNNINTRPNDENMGVKQACI